MSRARWVGDRYALWSNREDTFSSFQKSRKHYGITSCRGEPGRGFLRRLMTRIQRQMHSPPLADRPQALAEKSTAEVNVLEDSELDRNCSDCVVCTAYPISDRSRLP